jgi:hypothetical protein
MTKTAAVAAARRSLQYGYFTAGQTLWLNCPDCHRRQETGRGYRQFPARKGQPANVDPATGKRTIYRQETVREALLRMMTDHFTHWCDATRGEA